MWSAPFSLDKSGLPLYRAHWGFNGAIKYQICTHPGITGWSDTYNIRDGELYDKLVAKLRSI